MKILRSFPVIATAILGLIGLGLYKTSSFVNKKVAIEQQLSLDSLAAAPSAIAPLVDTLSGVQNQLMTPSIATDTTELDAAKLSETAMPESTTQAASTVVMSDKSKGEAPKNGAKKMPNKSPQTAKLAVNKSVVKTPAVPRFHVVIGSYKVEKNAKSEASKYEKKTHKKATVLKNKGFYRVSTNDFDTEKEANDCALKLKETGDKCLVLKF